MTDADDDRTGHDAAEPSDTDGAAGELLDARDEEVLADLARVLTTVDPVPEGLADRALFALTLERLRADVLELEQVLTPELVARSHDAEREMVRVSTITFASEPVTVMVNLSQSASGGLCIDGWVAPADSYRVELYRPGGHVATDSDEDGAFVLLDVPRGAACLALRRSDGTGPTVCTPVIEL
ncbi:hypothetical protein GXB85_01845 [Cellulomonas sp. APG4]|uniref:hypothetical protein n=1 Tax=Cellulomonas sp. APG4 TaxID=1538656 RepID=UPI00137B791A|nr:hypothetical protein [Cellulomonas sp. APG4]NCT89703.1 hypothetical protein [Cellulomonas sp. APG4]